MSYELHYLSGGHGGPYSNLREAWVRANALIAGSPNEHTIVIRTRKDDKPLMRTTRIKGIEVFDRESSQWIAPLYSVLVDGKPITNEHNVARMANAFSDICLALSTAFYKTLDENPSASGSIVTLRKIVAPGIAHTLLEHRVTGEFKPTRDELLRFDDDKGYTERGVVFEELIPLLESLR